MIRKMPRIGKGGRCTGCGKTLGVASHDQEPSGG